MSKEIADSSDEPDEHQTARTISSGQVFQEVFGSSEMLDLANDAISSFLEEMPGAGLVQKLAAVARRGREEWFLKKLINFFDASDELASQQRRKLWHDLTADRDEEYLGGLLISYIERSESPGISTLMGRATHEFAEGRISADEFWRLQYGLSHIPKFVIDSIQEIKTKDGFLWISEYADMLLSTGFYNINFVGGVSGGAKPITPDRRMMCILYHIREKLPIPPDN